MFTVSVALFTIILAISSITNANPPTTPFEKLQQEVQAGTVFTQETSEERCPRSFQAVESEYLPEGAKAGDVIIRLRAINPDGGDFWHEGNTFYYRPGKRQGKSHVLNRDLSFPAGVAYTVSTQTEKNGKLLSEYSAEIATFSMVASAYYKLEYDSNTGTIKYHFSGNGVPDVNCTFVKQ